MVDWFFTFVFMLIDVQRRLIIAIMAVVMVIVEDATSMVLLMPIFVFVILMTILAVSGDYWRLPAIILAIMIIIIIINMIVHVDVNRGPRGFLLPLPPPPPSERPECLLTCRCSTCRAVQPFL